MSPNTKAILKAAVLNGLFWSAILMGVSYFKNGLLNTNYLPLWFLFFAGTGASRKYYFLNKQSEE